MIRWGFSQAVSSGSGSRSGLGIWCQHGRSKHPTWMSPGWHPFCIQFFGSNKNPMLSDVKNPSWLGKSNLYSSLFYNKSHFFPYESHFFPYKSHFFHLFFQLSSDFSSHQVARRCLWMPQRPRAWRKRSPQKLGWSISAGGWGFCRLNGQQICKWLTWLYGKSPC